MLNLDPYGLGSIQDCLTLLAAAADMELSMAEVIAALQDRVDQATAEHAARLIRYQEQRPTTREQASCPECGAGLVRVKVEGSEWIEICRSCRWSRYLGRL